jgi:undecaprenyl-diphosphatase
MIDRTGALRISLGLALGFLLVAALVRGGLIQGLDAAGLRAAAALRGPILTTLVRGVTRLGSGSALFPAAVVFAAVLWRRGARWALFYLVAALAGWGLSSGLKALFARPRPTVTTHLDGAGWWSFPSGHTMESTVVLGLGILLVTGWMRNRGAARLARVITAVVLMAIGLSRVYLGVHYPSDVLGGWLAGGAWISGMLAFFSAGRAELHPVSPPGTS